MFLIVLSMWCVHTTPFSPHAVSPASRRNLLEPHLLSEAFLSRHTSSRAYRVHACRDGPSGSSPRGWQQGLAHVGSKEVTVTPDADGGHQMELPREAGESEFRV